MPSRSRQTQRNREPIGGCQRHGLGMMVTWRVGEMMEVVKRYNLPVIRQISSEDIMYSMVTIVKDTVLYIRKLLRE